MKKIGQLFIVALFASAITSIGFIFLNQDNKTYTIKHVDSTPVVGAAYTVNQNGEVVPLQFTDVAKQVMEAVVHIKSVQIQNSQSNQEVPLPFRDFFKDDMLKDFFGPHFKFERKAPQQRGPYTRVSTGSGVIINSEGYIVTNNHVIDGADDIEVSLHDNRVFKAKVIGTDPTTDLAVIQIKEKELTHIPFVNSDEVEIGEWVLAVGNPFNLNSTVTAGIVSAKGRNINILQSQSAIESFIQTDAAINPGNSGGALVNLKGGLIGINTAIASPTGSYSGYGFAIPSNIVSKVVEDILLYGFVQRGYMGITIRSVDGNFAKEKDLDVTEGVYVDSLLNESSAKEAGLQKGDVIVKVNKNKIKASSDLLEIVGRHRPGDKLEVGVNRFGKEKVFEITLKNAQGESEVSDTNKRDILSKLGVEIVELDQKKASKMDVSTGLMIKKLNSGLLRNQTNIKEGFVITHVDDKRVETIRQLEMALKGKSGGVMLKGVYPNYPGQYYYAFGIDN
eukprot:TRINITY_DN2173_c0_g2_i1.p1 TRINITY_DN2173_c0_g2~~TRINITY_DN2173_c0_g2_i1.p1  ORF type:complete len:506 (-),score=61.50 TRINITY_DN2173_c0_g2_i1:2776-4293(-)